MGLLQGLLGNASQVDISEVEQDLEQILISGEKIEKAYKLVRDLIIFSNKRLILVDKQGITGHKIEFHSVPYKNILHFSVETGGTLDLDADLKIWVSGSYGMIERKFKKGDMIFEIHRTLADYVIG